MPAHRAGLRSASLRSLDDLVEVVAALLACEPSAVELLDRTFLELVGQPSRRGTAAVEAMLLVEIERDDPGSLRPGGGARRGRGAAVGRRRGHGVSPRRAPSGSGQLRHAASPILAGLPEDRRSLQVIEDGCVPVERMGDYIRSRAASAAAGATSR